MSVELPNGRGLQFVENDSGHKVVWLHTGVEIKLDYVGPPNPTGPDLREVVSSKPAVSVAVVARSKAKLTFSVKANAPDIVELTAYNDMGFRDEVLVVFAGDFKNHPGMDIDLLANVCKGSDPVKSVQIQHLLFDDSENVFDQHSKENETKIGKMMCGKVAKESGEKVFGAISPLTYTTPYHEPLYIDKVTDRANVKYTADTILRVELAIKSRLEKGIPVRVGVLDGPVGMRVHDHKLVATDGGGHTVLIVGCGKDLEKLFLYIDPWGGPLRTYEGREEQFGGSKMKYGGGIAGASRPDWCLYMGMFEAKFDPTRAAISNDAGEKLGRPNILRQTIATEDGFNTLEDSYLEIVDGPPI